MLKCFFSSQFFLHGSDLRSLHHNLPPRILPEEYGGTAGKLDISTWNELLLASEDDFMYDVSQLPLSSDCSPHDPLMSEEIDEKQHDDSLRSFKTQLYSCY